MTDLIERLNYVANEAYEAASALPKADDPHLEGLIFELVERTDAIARHTCFAMDGECSLWSARTAAVDLMEYADLEADISAGRDLWRLVDEWPNADAFWNVIHPMILALGAVPSDEAGYGEGFSVESALEQLLEEVRARRLKHELS
jgi:hypothetical protein